MTCTHRVAGAVLAAALVAALPVAAAADDAVDVPVVQLGNHTLYVPKGYASGFLGYAGNLQIHALLPCLLPETPDNSKEFHTNTFGNILTATLSVSDPRFVSREQMLQTHIENSKFMAKDDKTKRYAEYGPFPLPGTKRFVLYHDFLLSLDVILDTKSDPPFFVECTSADKYAHYAHCSASYTIWRDTNLYYWYDRSFVDNTPAFIIEIDAELNRLLAAFRMSASAANRVSKEGVCK